MAHPTQLNATEQDTLVKQIGLSLLRAAPRDWRSVTAVYRAVGRYHELTGEVVTADGATQEWVATHDIATLFGKLRAGMYREGRGTWFNARYQLDHPSSYNLEYDREEPAWDLAPPSQAYADELRLFPRSEENVPDWLMRRMAGLGPERSGPRFRTARIFDGAGPHGPVVNRPELGVDERDRVLEYLDAAPVVVPVRGYDVDRLAPAPTADVPIAFHSDGSWIWPAAVNHYLREHGVAPEPDLVQHIRANGFAAPEELPEETARAAAAHVTHGQAPQDANTGAEAPATTQSTPPAPDPADTHEDATTTRVGAAHGVDASGTADLDTPNDVETTDPGDDARPGIDPAAAGAAALGTGAVTAGAAGFAATGNGTDSDSGAAEPDLPVRRPGEAAQALDDHYVNGTEHARTDEPIRAFQPAEEFEDTAAHADTADRSDAGRGEVAHAAPAPGAAAAPDHDRNDDRGGPGYDEPDFGGRPAEPSFEQSTAYTPMPGFGARHRDVGSDDVGSEYADDRVEEHNEDAGEHGGDRFAPQRREFMDPADVGRNEPGVGSRMSAFDADETAHHDMTGPAGDRAPYDSGDTSAPDTAATAFTGADSGIDSGPPTAFTTPVTGDPEGENPDHRPAQHRSPEPPFEGEEERTAPTPRQHVAESNAAAAEDTADRNGSGLNGAAGLAGAAGVAGIGGVAGAMGAGAREAHEPDVPAPGQQDRDPRSGADRPGVAGGPPPAPAPVGGAEPAVDEHDAGPPTQIGNMPPQDPELDDLQDKLDELEVPDEHYVLGMPAEYGWSIERVAEGWRVGWYEGGLKSPAVFGDAADAKAFMLGKVLLSPDGLDEAPDVPAEDHEAEQPVPEPEPQPQDAAPARPLTTTLSPEVATGVAAAQPAEQMAGGTRMMSPDDGAAGRAVPAGPPPTPPREPAAQQAAPPRRAATAEPRQGGQQWPIQPLPGEPPLTLFRGKEMRTLPAGSELDRFGGANGNLTYAAGTPFEERSLVPEWVNRPYHVYRVQRPLETLAGVAIPWFNQPGGGAAYMLPASIEELLADGDLIELDPGEPPID